MVPRVQAGGRLVERDDHRGHLERRLVARWVGRAAEHQRRRAGHRVEPRAGHHRELRRRLELGRPGLVPVRLGQAVVERNRPVRADARIAHARQLRQPVGQGLELSTVSAAQLHLAAISQAHHTGDTTVGQDQRRRVRLAVVADGAALVNSRIGVETVRLAKRRPVAVGEQRKIAEREVERLAPRQFQPQWLAAVERRGQRHRLCLARRRRARFPLGQVLDGFHERLAERLARRCHDKGCLPIVATHKTAHGQTGHEQRNPMLQSVFHFRLRLALGCLCLPLRLGDFSGLVFWADFDFFLSLGGLVLTTQKSACFLCRSMPST